MTLRDLGTRRTGQSLYTLKEVGEMITKIQDLLGMQGKQHTLHLEGFTTLMHELRKTNKRITALEGMWKYSTPDGRKDNGGTN